jgi:type II secretory pathway component PulF
MWLFAATSRPNNGILSFGTSNSTFTVILFASSNLLSGIGYSNVVALPIGSWFHIAYVRQGTGTNQSRVYLNGVLINQSTNASNYTQTFYNIGIYFSTGFCWGANIDNFRVTKAVRYLTNFNPETDTYMG